MSDINVLFLSRWLRTFEGEGGLEAISRSYEKFGLILKENGDIQYREWAPSAQALSIVSIVALSLLIMFSFSLATSTTGTEKSIGVRRIILGCLPSHSKPSQTAPL